MVRGFDTLTPHSMDHDLVALSDMTEKLLTWIFKKTNLCTLLF